MERDTQKTFQEIHGSHASLLTHMKEIERALEYVDHNCPGIETSLRFLCTDPHGRTVDGTVILRLADKTENLDERNYVAVSYCWGSPDEDSLDFSYAILAPNGQTRPLRCPTRVIHRTLQYAQAKAVPFIWIDQECINQDNPEDVQKHLKSMHKIYSESNHAIGLLTRHIFDFDQLEALKALLDALRATEDETHKHFLLNFEDPVQFAGQILKLLQAIQDDKYYSRTWTFQEEYCSIPHGFRLLLPVSSFLEFDRLPPILGKTIQEVDLHLQSLCDAVYLLACLLRDQALPETASDGSSIPEMLEENIVSLSGYRWNASQGPLGHTIQQSSWSRYGKASLTDIFQQIEKRNNLVVSDRIAILANLCSFQFRLNTSRLNFRRYSYSTCVLTLLYHNDILPLVSLLKGKGTPTEELMIMPLGATIGQVLGGILHVNASGTGPRVNKRLLFYAKHCSVLDQSIYYNETGNPPPEVYYAHSHVWKKTFTRSHFQAPLPPMADSIWCSIFSCSQQRRLRKQATTSAGHSSGRYTSPSHSGSMGAWSTTATPSDCCKAALSDIPYSSENIIENSKRNQSSIGTRDMIENAKCKKSNQTTTKTENKIESFERNQTQMGTRALERGIITLILDSQTNTAANANKIAEIIARSFNHRLMELLLDSREADIEITDDILEAVVQNEINGPKIIELLLQRRGDTLDVSDWTVGTIAFRFDEKIMKLLLDKRGEEVRITENVIIAVARHKTQARNKTMELLLQRRSHTITITRAILGDLIWHFDQPIRQQFQSAIARTLVNMEVNTNEQKNYLNDLLLGASLTGLEEILQIILDKGADVNAEGSYYTGNALQVACNMAHEKIAQILLDRGAEDSNIFNTASYMGFEKVVQILLDKGADANAQTDDYLGNALQIASYGGHEKVVQILLEKGADVNAQSGCLYRNALQAASYNGHEKVVQVLLDKGADVNAQGGCSYRNALQAAFYNGHEKIVQMLLHSGAEMQPSTTKAGFSEDHKRVVQSLSNQHADIDAPAQGNEDRRHGNESKGGEHDTDSNREDGTVAQGDDLQGGEHNNDSEREDGTVIDAAVGSKRPRMRIRALMGRVKGIIRRIRLLVKSI